MRQVVSATIITAYGSGRESEMKEYKSENDLPERVRQNIAECWDSEEEEFDWDLYQYLCDCQAYWDVED